MQPAYNGFYNKKFDIENTPVKAFGNMQLGSPQKTSPRNITQGYQTPPNSPQKMGCFQFGTMQKGSLQKISPEKIINEHKTPPNSPQKMGRFQPKYSPGINYGTDDDEVSELTSKVALDNISNKPSNLPHALLSTNYRKSCQKRLNFDEVSNERAPDSRPAKRRAVAGPDDKPVPLQPMKFSDEINTSIQGSLFKPLALYPANQ
jgi:hypothetical protein